jgi:hypothetical protein
VSRILCEFRFPSGEIRHGVWCDTTDLLVTRRTFDLGTLVLLDADGKGIKSD